MPNIDRIWINSKFLENENANKFHGNPVKIFPLINSIVAKIDEKIKINEIFL